MPSAQNLSHGFVASNILVKLRVRLMGSKSSCCPQVQMSILLSDPNSKFRVVLTVVASPSGHGSELVIGIGES
ncbi:UNVERIFIED_CONTAM: hypothetical protein NCL1_13198 [Trichonephila clavipes]